MCTFGHGEGRRHSSLLSQISFRGPSGDICRVPCNSTAKRQEDGQQSLFRLRLQSKSILWHVPIQITRRFRPALTAEMKQDSVLMLTPFVRRNFQGTSFRLEEVSTNASCWHSESKCLIRRSGIVLTPNMAINLPALGRKVASQLLCCCGRATRRPTLLASLRQQG